MHLARLFLLDDTQALYKYFELCKKMMMNNEKGAKNSIGCTIYEKIFYEFMEQGMSISRWDNPTDEWFRPTDEWLEPTDEWFKLTDEWFRPTDEWFKPTDESFRPTDEWLEPTDESFRPTDRRGASPSW